MRRLGPAFSLAAAAILIASARVRVIAGADLTPSASVTTSASAARPFDEGPEGGCVPSGGSGAQAPGRAVALRLDGPRGPWWIGRVTFDVQVEAPAGDPVERVEFFLDGARAGICRQEPYRLARDFGEHLASHRLVVVARTFSGLSGSLTVVSTEPALHQRAGVELVLIPVSVLGPDGEPLLDLTREDFALFEDGAPEPIAVFDTDPSPVSLVFALDCSGSMQNPLPLVKAAAITFLQKLPPRFSASFFAFDERAWPLVDFTLDRDHLYYEIGRRQAKGTGTAILGACRAALSALRSRPGKRAAAIFTDGEETAVAEESRSRAIDELAAEARLADTAFYFVVYGRQTRSALTEAIASATGGESLTGGSPRRVNEAFARIGARLGAQYTLGYRPRTPGLPGDWRSLRVEVARAGASVVARPGWGVARKASLTHR